MAARVARRRHPSPASLPGRRSTRTSARCVRSSKDGPPSTAHSARGHGKNDIYAALDAMRGKPAQQRDPRVAVAVRVRQETGAGVCQPDHGRQGSREWIAGSGADDRGSRSALVEQLAIGTRPTARRRPGRRARRPHRHHPQPHPRRPGHAYPAHHPRRAQPAARRADSPGVDRMARPPPSGLAAHPEPARPGQHQDRPRDRPVSEPFVRNQLGPQWIQRRPHTRRPHPARSAHRGARPATPVAGVQHRALHRHPLCDRRRATPRRRTRTTARPVSTAESPYARDSHELTAIRVHVCRKYRGFPPKRFSHTELADFPGLPKVT